MVSPVSRGSRVRPADDRAEEDRFPRVGPCALGAYGETVIVGERVPHSPNLPQKRESGLYV